MKLVTGWRAAVVLLVALAVAALLIAVAVWAMVALAVVGAVLWLNLVLLPRLSLRLHVPSWLLELTLLPVLAGSGWFLGGVPGALLGGLAWLVGIAVPRLASRRLRARIRTAASGPGTVIVVPDGRSLPPERAR